MPGSLVLGRAGLFNGCRFASHWYYRKTLLDRTPGVTYVPHQRYVIDRGIATTTGITASVPAMFALAEAIGRATEYLLTKAAFWRHERWSVDVRNDMDDVALALAADAWSRTGRVSVEAASDSGPVRLRSGMVLVAQPAVEDRPRLPLAAALKPAQQLDRTLCEIAERYGASRREWVMMEMKYAGPAADCAR